VLGRADPEEAGRYSRHQRAIAGSPLILPSPAEIPARMGDFARWLAAAPDEPATAFAAHARLAAIHPFSDGNGRAARLLMNLILLRAGYRPMVIGPEQRAAYIDALQAMQLKDDPAPYDALMVERLEASLDHHLEMARRGLGP
jgi:Fic family protein